MKAKVTKESIANFERGIVGDFFSGVMCMKTYVIHLAQSQRRDGVEVGDRKSVIKKIQREPVPDAGGHAKLAEWGGIKAKQIGIGAATGKAVGFTITKTASGFVIFSWKSGLNIQYTFNGDSREMPMSFQLPVKLALAAALLEKSAAPRARRRFF